MSTASSRPDRNRWSARRVARLGFLLGQGASAQAVAADPQIASTAANVHRQAQRYGLAFRDLPSWILPPAINARFDAAAARRGLTRDGLIRDLLVAAGSDPALIDNILDDED